ncbi:MAG: DUF4838 domain-containing protein [bacterium]|nr:DUF4838 domain-containing protein [bacterium]
MRICGGGKAEARIAVMPGTGEIGRFAADELQKYVRKMSGVELPVKAGENLEVTGDILLCYGKDADRWCEGKAVSGCKEDSYAIRVTDDRLYLLGQNERGLLYAVYVFLEDELGVGFLAPGDENEWVPRRRVITVKPSYHLAEPAMRLRGFSCSLIDEVDWMAKNKMNYVLVDENTSGELIEEAKKRRMMLYFSGHSFYRWLPPAEYWETHPEYYSLLNGERVCNYQQGEHMGHQQICVSNPDVIGIVSQNIIRFIEEYPENDFYTLWPNDAEAWCECENCRALDGGEVNPLNGNQSNAGSYVYFANRVAERVAVVHPEKKLNIIAYRSTLVPPSDPTVFLHPNIVLEVAYWGRPCDHPVGQSITEEEIARRMRRAEIGSEEFDTWKRRYLVYGEFLQRWGEIAKGDLLIFDYMMASQSTLSLPYPMFGTVQEDHKFYREIGVAGCYMQAHKNNCTAYGLNYWMGAKAYWGGPQDVDKCLNEFCEKRFGAGAVPVKTYFQVLERSFRSQTCGFSPFTVSRILRPEVVDKCRKALEAAASLVHRNPQKEWLARTRLHFEYAYKTKLYYDACRLIIYQIHEGNEAESMRSLMDAYLKTRELYDQVMELRGCDILSAYRVVLHSLIKQEGKRHGDVPLASVEAAEKVTEYLWPRLYDIQGW